MGFIARLAADGVTVIDSAVFNGGFLTCGDKFDYRTADPVKDAALFAKREAYLSLPEVEARSRGRGGRIRPAHPWSEACRAQYVKAGAGRGERRVRSA